MLADEQFHEQACFFSQQAGEKAAKAVCEAKEVRIRADMGSRLLRELPASVTIPSDIENAAKSLDHHYIPARYPSAFDSGAPADFHTAGQAEDAISRAEEVIAFCKRHIPG